MISEIMFIKLLIRTTVNEKNKFNCVYKLASGHHFHIMDL